MTVTNPRLDELAAAFRLLFAHLTQCEQEQRLEDALALVEAGQLDPEGVFVVRDARGLRGAVAAMPLTGAGGILWTPGLPSGPERDAVGDALVQAALRWLKSRGARVAHALPYIDEAARAAPLLRNGFNHITRLQYLQLTLTEDAARQLPRSPIPQLTLQTYAQTSPAVFHETLLRTYEGSLDCPELNGLRTLDEIIAGHQAQGEYDPGRWWLASAPEPVGVLLLAEMAAWDSWDISYVGVVPQARRRGIARALIQQAARQAQSAGMPLLTVAVDLRNHPARKLYTDLGFQPAEQREVFLAVL